MQLKSAWAAFSSMGKGNAVPIKISVLLMGTLPLCPSYALKNAWGRDALYRVFLKQTRFIALVRQTR
ncbi:MAG: hypothetical protein WCS87_04495 [Methylococcaceae bacterium]